VFPLVLSVDLPGDLRDALVADWVARTDAHHDRLRAAGVVGLRIDRRIPDHVVAEFVYAPPPPPPPEEAPDA
jgi:hypothetical protein